MARKQRTLLVVTDSWFSLPLKCDIGDELGFQYEQTTIGKHGLTMKAFMNCEDTAKGEHLEKLKAVLQDTGPSYFDAMVVSLGGNDLVDQLPSILNESGSASDLDEKKVTKAVRDITSSYQSLLKVMQSGNDASPDFSHPYEAPIAGGC